jgi:hypothetical protein
MSSRRDLFIAITLVLRRMGELAVAMGKPNAKPERLQEERRSLHSKYQALMVRLAELNDDGTEPQE